MSTLIFFATSFFGLTSKANDNNFRKNFLILNLMLFLPKPSKRPTILKREMLLSLQRLTFVIKITGKQSVVSKNWTVKTIALFSSFSMLVIWNWSKNIKLARKIIQLTVILNIYAIAKFQMWMAKDESISLLMESFGKIYKDMEKCANSWKECAFSNYL